MKRNVHQVYTVKIAKRNASAQTIHLAIQRPVNVFVTKDGQVIRAVNHVLKDSTATDARKNVRTLFMAINRVIM